MLDQTDKARVSRAIGMGQQAGSGAAGVSRAGVPVETLNLQITQREIHWAVQSGLKKPVFVALQQATGTLWRLYEDGLAIEVMVPYRACILPEEALREVRDGESPCPLLGTAWEVVLFPTEGRDGYSLLQRRQVPRELTRGRG